MVNNAIIPIRNYHNIIAGIRRKKKKTKKYDGRNTAVIHIILWYRNDFRRPRRMYTERAIVHINMKTTHSFGVFGRIYFIVVQEIVLYSGYILINCVHNVMMSVCGLVDGYGWAHLRVQYNIIIITTAAVTRKR